MIAGLPRVAVLMICLDTKGTGKSMGILQAPDVIERSAADFISQHIGYTIPKTQDLINGGIGKVLVIDDVHSQRAATHLRPLTS
jgi:hypothetical protein